MAYCTRADMLAFLPSGGLPNSARVATGSSSGNWLENDQHGLIDDQAVTFRAESGGALPTGLSEDTTYYAVVVNTSRFQVSTIAGGAVVDLTTGGSNFVFIAELPWDAWIDAASRDVDSFLPAHVVPVVEPYPQILVTATAELAAARGLIATAGAEINLGIKLDAIANRLARWAKSLPLRGTARSTTSPVNLAITSTVGASDPRGWTSRGKDVLP